MAGLVVISVREWIGPRTRVLANCSGEHKLTEANSCAIINIHRPHARKTTAEYSEVVIQREDDVPTTSLILSETEVEQLAERIAAEVHAAINEIAFRRYPGAWNRDTVPSIEVGDKVLEFALIKFHQRH